MCRIIIVHSSVVVTSSPLWHNACRFGPYPISPDCSSESSTHRQSQSRPLHFLEAREGEGEPLILTEPHSTRRDSLRQASSCPLLSKSIPPIQFQYIIMNLVEFWSSLYNPVWRWKRGENLETNDSFSPVSCFCSYVTIYLPSTAISFQYEDTV